MARHPGLKKLQEIADNNIKRSLARFLPKDVVQTPAPPEAGQPELTDEEKALLEADYSKLA